MAGEFVAATEQPPFRLWISERARAVVRAKLAALDGSAVRGVTAGRVVRVRSASVGTGWTCGKAVKGVSPCSPKEH
ncbi:hypothetical protein GCM10009639_52590 [Kitasatospora putterlickiae]|uniref:Uncharacterized protein n=1 Tax=Kitasatospora putterlickiae TaxID=221725 RepID=A0ABN1YDD2_9ACTN